MATKKRTRYGMLGMGFERYLEATQGAHEQGTSIQWFLVRLPEPLLKEIVNEKKGDDDIEIPTEKIDMGGMDAYRSGWLNREGGHDTVIVKIMEATDPASDMIYCGRGYVAYKRMYAAATLARIRLVRLGLPIVPQKDGFPTYIFAEESDEFYDKMLPLIPLFFALPGSEEDSVRDC